MTKKADSTKVESAFMFCDRLPSPQGGKDVNSIGCAPLRDEIIMKRIAPSLLLSVSLGVLGFASPAASQTVRIDADDIGGVVTGAAGPEAGVWVIAETRDLPTKYVKIAVTDDAGRYVLPDLPKANYDVWVRGYGLVDSPKVKSEPGKALNLKAVPAPDAKAAAQYYPAIYWFSMLKIPEIGRAH